MNPDRNTLAPLDPEFQAACLLFVSMGGVEVHHGLDGFGCKIVTITWPGREFIATQETMTGSWAVYDVQENAYLATGDTPQEALEAATVAVEQSVIPTSA